MLIHRAWTIQAIAIAPQNSANRKGRITVRAAIIPPPDYLPIVLRREPKAVREE
jgi:hypothetical protein